jgi:hypothetical protein
MSRIILLLSLSGLMTHVHVQAQDLDDAIEAELDNLGDPVQSGGSGDIVEDTFSDLDLDEAEEAGLESELEAEPQRASQPAPKMQSSSSWDSSGLDEPNRAFEQRLFRIFSQSQPISQSRWEEVIGARREEIYSIQAGDTLWDISQTFFGDGFFWSKLWAENSSFENPHEIRPGQMVRFVSGTESSAPSIGVEDSAPYLADLQRQDNSTRTAPVPTLASGASESIVVNPMLVGSGRPPIYRQQAMKKLSPEELAGSEEIEVDEILPDPEIPPQSRPSRPVLRNLPPSFVQHQYKEVGLYDSTGLDAGKVRALMVPATVIPNSFIVDEAVSESGRVAEIEAGEKVASTGQAVFLRMKTDAKRGDKFSVLFPREKIKVGVVDSVGPVMEVGGTVEILGKVEDNQDYYRALVTLSVNPIRLGSVVTTMELPRGTFTRRGTRTTIETKIIGGEFDANRKIFGEGSVVFLDAGKEAGLKVGDILPIQGRRGVRRPDSKIPYWQKPIGLVKVIKTENRVSTAFVLETRDEVLVGDRTGGTIAGSKGIYKEEWVEGVE